MPARIGAARMALLGTAAVLAILPPSILSASTRACLQCHGSLQSQTAWLTSRIGHRTNAAGTNVRLHYFSGFTSSAGNSSDLPGTQPTTVRAALIVNPNGTGADQSAGTLYRATFFDMLNDSTFTGAGGTVSGDGYKVTIPAGFWAYTDRIPVTLARGDRFYEQAEVGYVSGTSVGNFNLLTSAGDMSASSTTDPAGATVYAKSSASFNTGGSGITGAVAVTVEGATGAKSILVHGDSIFWGTAGSGATEDTPSADGVLGGICKALADLGYSVFKAAIPSSQVGNLYSTPANRPFRQRMSQIGTIGAVISNLGTNDRGGGTVWSDVSTQFNWWWNAVHTWTGGARFIQATLSPRTTSTDNWATDANQADTVGGNHWCTITLNPSLRTGNFAALGSGTSAPDGWYDFSLAVESTAIARVWKGASPPLTLDGLHPSPSPNGHIAVHDDAVANLPRVIGFDPITGAATPINPTPVITMAPGPNLAEGNSGSKAFPFVFYCYPAPASPLTVNLQFNQGTTDASDFQGGVLPSINSVTFAAGATSATVNVMVAGDATQESDDTFGFTVLAGSGYRAGVVATATAVIQNDEPNAGVVYTTDFAGTDNTLLTASPFNMAMSGKGNAPSLADLVNYKVLGNNAYAIGRWNVGNYNYGHPTRDAASTNHSVSLSRVNSTWDLLPIFGEVDGSNFLYFSVLVVNGVPGFQVGKMQGGTLTQGIVNTYWFVPASATTLEVRWSNGAITVFADGVQYANQAYSASPTPSTTNPQPVTPGNVPTGGTKAGFYCAAASAGRADNFTLKQL